MFVSEYNRITLLSNMGLGTDINSLDSFDIEVFCLIAQEYQTIEKEMQDRQNRKSKRG